MKHYHNFQESSFACIGRRKNGFQKNMALNESSICVGSCQKTCYIRKYFEYG